MAEKNTFLVQEVIDDLIDIEISLTSSLMKLSYFSKLTKNNELLEFVSNELNGYEFNDNNLPEFRKTISRLMVDVHDRFNNNYKVEVPVAMIEEPYNIGFKYILIRDGIGTIERMVKNIEDEFHKGMPMQLLTVIQPAVSKLYKNQVTAFGATLVGNGNVFIEILNRVRSKLLGLTMDIGDKFGYNIEIASFKKNQEINNQTINNYMHTEITNTGDANVVNTGNNADVSATITISKGDVQKLNTALEELGVDRSDVEELNQVIQTEIPDYENKKLGERANNWLLKIFGKSLNGIGKIATSASGNLLATMIKQFYGMDS